MNTLTKYFVFFLLISQLLCNHASADSGFQDYESFMDVQFVDNYDGDTISFDIQNAPAILGKNMAIRLRGIDTPELKKKTCLAEKEKAETAKQLVYSLLKNARSINLHRIKRGKYFRMIADVEFDGQDLATILLEKNLAVKYSGGKKEFNWCQKSNTVKKSGQNTKYVLPPKVSGVYVWPPPPVQKSDTK